MPSAEELHRRGVVAMNAGRLPAASRLMRRALEGATDPALRARVEASLAYVATDASDLATALEQCERTLAFPDLPDDVRGVLLCQRALILRRSGHVAQALETFDAAIDRLVGQPSELGKAYLNRGTVHLDRRDLGAAARDFAAASHFYGEAGETVAGAKADHNRGYTLFLAGDIVGALRTMEQAHAVLRGAGPLVEAVNAQDRAEVLLAAGMLKDGATLLQQAADSYGRRRMRQRQAEAELTRATSMLAYDPRAALEAARRARRRFTALGAEAWRVRAEAEVFAAEVDLGEVRRSLVTAADALARALTDQGLPWRATAVELRAARILVRRGEVQAARDRLRTARAGRPAPLDVRLLERDVRAELAVASGRPASALRDLRAGLAELHEWQSSFGSLDLQTNVVGHGVRLAKRGLELAVAARSTAVLFEWSERARMLASRVQPVYAPRDEQLAAALAELRAEPPPDREAELRRRIREQAWQQRGSGQVTEPVSLPQLQAGIGDAALVAYVVTDDRLVALVVTSEHVVRRDLGRRAAIDPLLSGLLADLDMAAAELDGPMAVAVRGALGVRLGRLADVLVEPLLPDVDGRPVVLTPSGVLAGVPWTLLEGYAGRPVTVAQSATSWVTRRATPLRLGNAGFVAGPRVARAEDEVVAAAKEWQDARVVTGTGARTSTVSELAGEVDVLHVAAHGRHSAENPLFSGVELVDGPWFGYDIDGLERVPDVVVLSACEVGRSSVRWGEELIGMSTAWLHAGARCVIASAAAVNDEAAYDALRSLHQELAAGAEPAAALATALRRRRPDAAPAPFVCFG